MPSTASLWPPANWRAHGVLAMKLGGKGDVTKINVLWKEKKGLGEVPSLLRFNERVLWSDTRA